MKVGSREFEFGRKTYVMGILNVTPDSFSDGGRFINLKDAVEHARKMVGDGADIIDVGGESTRPGSKPVTVEEELSRVIPVIKALSEIDAAISIDTCKPEVAFRAVEAGACMLNDINALRTKGMAEFAAARSIPVVLMHMQGTPRDMQKKPSYRDVVADINRFFEERIAFATQRGVSRENIILDPGIGFGKTLQHNLELIRNLGAFKKRGLPVMVGPSRKSFLGQVLNLPVGERIEGTLAAVTACIAGGADIVRVHDVKEAVRTARVADSIYRIH